MRLVPLIFVFLHPKSLTVELDVTRKVICTYHQGPNYIWLQTNPLTVDRIAEDIW